VCDNRRRRETRLRMQHRPEEQVVKCKWRAADDDSEGEAEEEWHWCAQCEAEFPLIKRLNEHKKRAHALVTNCTCPFCAWVFLNTGSLPRHMTICPEQPEVSISCIMLSSNVPPSTTNPHTKARSGKRSYTAVRV
jgi:hypothetical protein